MYFRFACETPIFPRLSITCTLSVETSRHSEISSQHVYNVAMHVISQNTPNRHAISQSLVIQTHSVINIPSIPAAALRGVWRKQYVNFDVSQTQFEHFDASTVL
jgi:hypothetical protein